MTKKRITQGGERTDARPTVDRSRRRFTGATLTASAILTLASRPAFAGCGGSVTPSAQASRQAAGECDGNQPTVYLDPNMWPLGFDPGKPNPIEQVRQTYAYPTYEELEDAIEAAPEFSELRQSCEDYMHWAYPLGNMPDPSPVPPPNTFDGEFAVTGLSAADPTTTLMQALETSPDGLMGHVVAGLFNCYKFGKKVYGYTPDEFKQFVRESDPAKLLATLQRLNGR